MADVLASYPIPVPVMLGVLGALIGSFLNVVIIRLPLGQSIVHPPSHCPQCKYSIPWYLNIPVLSWLVLRGRCANCGAPISVRYPMIELLTALLFIAVGRRFGLSWATVAGLVFVSGLLVVTFVDIAYWEIPDEVSMGGIVVGVLIRPVAFDVPWYSGVAGAALGAGFLLIVRYSYYFVRKQEGMGLGDVKLLGMIGAFLGPGSLLPVILVASVSGTVFGVAKLALYRAPPDAPDEATADEPTAEASAPPEATGGDAPTDEDREEDRDENGDDDWEPTLEHVPFGPFLALGGMAVLFFGGVIQRALFHLRL